MNQGNLCSGSPEWTGCNLSLLEKLLNSYRTFRQDEQGLSERATIFRSLSQEELLVLKSLLIEKIKSAKSSEVSIAEEVVSDLLIHTNLDIDSLLLAFIEADESPDGSIFRGAMSMTKEKLYSVLKSNPDLGLLGLAWIGDDEIVSQFAEWKKTPPDFESLLPGTSSVYSRAAGWELEPSNAKRFLYSKTCFGIEPAGASESIDQSGAIAKGADSCLWCKRPTFRIANFQTSYLRSLFSLSLRADHIEIPFCSYCTGFREYPMYCTVSSDGRVEFDLRNDPNRKIPEPSYKYEVAGGDLSLQIDVEPRDPYFAARAFTRNKTSQIGGFPTWLQDAEYPQCSVCKRTMLFLMQIESSEFPVLSYEAIFYFFACNSCPGEFAIISQST